MYYYYYYFFYYYFLTITIIIFTIIIITIIVYYYYYFLLLLLLFVILLFVYYYYFFIVIILFSCFFSSSLSWRQVTTSVDSRPAQQAPASEPCAGTASPLRLYMGPQVPMEVTLDRWLATPWWRPWRICMKLKLYYMLHYLLTRLHFIYILNLCGLCLVNLFLTWIYSSTSDSARKGLWESQVAKGRFW